MRLVFLLLFIKIGSGAVNDQVSDKIMLAANYSKEKLPPTDDNQPVIVEASSYVGNILDVMDKKQQISLEIILRFFWTDRRLTPRQEYLTGKDPKGTYVNVHPSIIEHVWMPDAYIDEVLTIRTPKYVVEPASFRCVKEKSKSYI